MNNKLAKLITIILLITMITPIVLGATTPVNIPTNEVSDLSGSEATQNAIIREHLRTRTEIKNHIDSKVTEATNTFKTDGQKFIDDNFKVLDQRMQEIATKFLIKISIAIIACIVLAHAMWYYIYRVLIKKENSRPKNLSQDGLNQKMYGLINDEFKNKLEKEQTVQYASKPVPDYAKKEPVPPTVEMIQKQLQQKKQNQQTQQTPPVERKGFFKKIFKRKNQQTNQQIPTEATIPSIMDEEPIPVPRPPIKRDDYAEKAFKEELKRLNEEYEHPKIEVYETNNPTPKNSPILKKSATTMEQLNIQLEEINKKLKQLEKNG